MDDRFRILRKRENSEKIQIKIFDFHENLAMKLFGKNLSLFSFREFCTISEWIYLSSLMNSMECLWLNMLLQFIFFCLEMVCEIAFVASYPNKCITKSQYGSPPINAHLVFWKITTLLPYTVFPATPLLIFFMVISYQRNKMKLDAQLLRIHIPI